MWHAKLNLSEKSYEELPLNGSDGRVLSMSLFFYRIYQGTIKDICELTMYFSILSWADARTSIRSLARKDR